MVADPGNYRWSSYRVNALGVASELCTPHPEYLALGSGSDRLAAYRDLFRADLDDEPIADIRQTMQRGLALGDERFVREMKTRTGTRLRLRRPGPPARAADDGSASVETAGNSYSDPELRCYDDCVRKRGRNAAMPICEADPWRMQYFENVPCPEDVRIPTEDGDAYSWYPRHKWVYNKLQVAESQGMDCGPHGLDPPSFPVFSKPIYNMRGMGAGSRVFRTMKEYKHGQRPGHMWMALLEGEHVSTDVAVVDGEPSWWRHATGIPLEGGMFDHWVVWAEPRAELEHGCGEWIRANFRGYSGMMNLETIGGRIIEAHLRFADQWPDLYGRGWVEAVIELYRDGRWNFRDDDRQTGYSVVLFGAHGVHYCHPPADLVEQLLGTPGITSIQITFHEDRRASAHSMPPGGFRLAIVNGFDLEAQRRARSELALSYWSTQRLLPGRGRRAAENAAKAAD